MIKMKKISIIGLSCLLMLSFLFTGCEATKNANNTQKGAAIGGGTGALIGNKMDKQAREIDQALPGADVERVGEGIRLVLNENAVRFDTGKATLTATAKANLDKLVPVFKEYADTNIEIYGYTDITGSPEFNLTLSQKRAESVKNYLAS